MQQRIHILDESVKKKIAAGEVIEGPSSVVKELIENSIDAGSTRIRISVEEGGLKHVIVEDNGSGIHPDDVELALEEHATSKIEDADDIFSVVSYGFRGEALSSISSVSHLTVETRPESIPEGRRLTAEGGKIRTAPFVGSCGTRVHVTHLFYNTPARKKFLKSRGAESRRIRDVIIQIAVAHPEIHFEYVSDGNRKSIFQTRNTTSERLNDIFGAHFSESLYTDTLTDGATSITGYISKPGFYRKNRQLQFFYVNGRPVEYRAMSFHLNRAYDALLPRGEHPAAIIFLSIDPALVDVNVHPAKKEVRLFDSSQVDGYIYSLARKILDTREHHVPLAKLPDRYTEANTVTNEDTDTKSLPFGHTRTRSVPAHAVYEATHSHQAGYVAPAAVHDQQAAGYTILGIVFQTYLLVDHANALKIIDYHAAHERILYDRIIRETSFETQMLVFPEEYRITEHVRGAVEIYLDALSANGFDIDRFSDDSLIVRAVPSFLDRHDVTGFLDDFFTSATETHSHVDELKKAVCETMACHGAKRARDRMSTYDMQELAEKILSGNHELRCPHGRPVLLVLSESDIERFFRR